MRVFKLSLLALFFITACTKEKVNVVQDDLSVTVKNKIYTNAKYKGVYVDGFANILGDSIKEDSLLKWCKKYHFNAISIYNLQTILPVTANHNKVAAFVKRAKANYGINQVAAVRGSSNGFIETYQYNISRSDTTERFNVFNLEDEWWNNAPGCDFNCYVPELQTMDSLAGISSPAIIAEEYIGWLKNPTGQEAYQCSTLVIHSNRILVHDYRSAPDFNYVKDRLSYLGKAAKAQGKIFEVIILFSAESNFMFDYYNVNTQNNSFENAYASIVAQHNATSFSGKSNVIIIGYQVFAYSFARATRP